MPEEYLYGKSPFVSSCNGLVCFAHHDPRVTYIGNPMTRQFKKLPSPPKEPDSRLWRMVGFGFDDVSDDYKFIRFFVKGIHSRSYRIKAEMYSVNEDTWKEVKVPEGLEKFKFPLFRGVGIFLPDQTRVLYFEGFHELLSFDLHDEVFRVHPFPKPGKLPAGQGKPIRSSLLEFEGSVAKIYEESSDSWKEIRVPFDPETFQFASHGGGGVFRPDQSRVLYFEGSREVLSFDLHDEVFRVHPFPRPAKLPLQGEPKSYLLESEGSVAMICDESSGDGKTVRSLWTLDRDGGNWTKKFNFEDHLKYNHVILYLGDGQFVVAAESYGYGRRPIFYYYKKGNAREYLGASPARQLTSVVITLKGLNN
ncbi:hypothetical protein ACET3Z_004163 [Daucus carota]